MYLVSLYYEYCESYTPTPVCSCSTEEEAKRIVQMINSQIPEGNWRYTCEYENISEYENTEEFNKFIKLKIKELL